MKTTLIKITDDGLFGQAVNPYIKPILYQEGNVMLDEINTNSFQENMQEYDLLVKEFITNNPAYPLTKQGEPGKVCEANLIWQHKQWNDKDWNIGRLIHIGLETRHAFEVISNKEHPTIEEMAKHTMDRMPALNGLEKDKDMQIRFQKILSENNNLILWSDAAMKLIMKNMQDAYNLAIGDMTIEQPVAEQSIEDAANNYITIHFEENGGFPELKNLYIQQLSHFFIAGANHILNAKGLVSKDRVCEIIENYDVGGAFAEQTVYNMFTDLLNQIKEL